MALNSPIPFREALRRHEVRKVMPTNMGSGELREVHQGILQRSFFSARTTLAGYLQEAKSRIGELVDGKTDIATVRLRLKEELQRLDYSPSAEEAGTIKDLSSDRRLELVIRTNTQVAQNFGHWREGQDAAALDQWPAQELFRAEAREEERDWLSRWREAGESTGPINSGWTITPEGRMVALKNHAIWDQLGSVALFDDGLGNPFPPFAFNSGMDVRDIDREEAMELGLIDRDTQIEPETYDFELPPEAMPESLIIADPKPDRERAPREPEPAPVRPVSEALEVTRANAGPLEETKAIIDEVHSAPPLPKVLVDGKTQPENDAELVHDTAGNVFRMGVKDVPGQKFNLTHETGHLIDLKGFGTVGSASEAHPDLQEWRDAVRGTKLFRQMEKKAATTLDPEAKKYWRYLSSHTEMWARSYAQFIAERSGDPPLVTGVKEARKFGIAGGHWTERDFAPVRTAIEKLFTKKGWLK